MKRVFFVAIATSLFCTPLFGDDLITLWGPETFREVPCEAAQEDCEAQIFETDFGTLGVQPPFAIHVVNGDVNGGHKASAAALWVDGIQVFTPADFRPRTETLSETILLGESATLKIMLGGGSNLDGDEGDSLAQMTVYIQGYAPGTLRIASPLGNSVEYANSVVLKFPPGAVDDYTAIEVSDLACGAVDEIVENSRISTALRGCLGAFTATPDGLFFNDPVTAEFPVSAMQSPGGYPILLEIDIEDGAFGYRPTDVTYSREQGRASAAVAHFSGVAAVEASPFKAAEDCLADPDCLDLVELVEDCSYCDTWSIECSILGPIEPPCCRLSPSERKACKDKGKITGDCECCKEQTMHSKSDFTLLSNGSANCEIAGEQVEITFLDCPDKPTQSASMKGLSASCPKDLKVSLIISPDFAEVQVGQSATYEATIEGTTSDGTKIDFLEDTVGWSTGDTQVASFASSPVGQKVAVQGVDRGSTTVTAVETGVLLKDDAIISVDKEEEAEPVDVAFVVYNGQYDYSRFPPYGWTPWSPYAADWFGEFERFFPDSFDLSLVVYNKPPDRCPDTTWCGFDSGPCTAHATLMPFKEIGVPVSSEWESSWSSIRTVCDEDPNQEYGDKGSSLYSALIDTIRNRQWDPDAKLKALFVFPQYPTCAYYIGAGSGFTCDAEVGTNFTLSDVAAIANQEGIKLFVFNGNTGRLPECGGDNCNGNVSSFCYAVNIGARDEFIALANQTDGAYYSFYCEYANVNEAVKRAIFDLHSMATSSESAP